MFAFCHKPIISMSVQQKDGRNSLGHARQAISNLSKNIAIRARCDAKKLRSLRGVASGHEHRQRRAMHHLARRSLRALLLRLWRKEFVAWRTERSALADRHAASEVNIAVDPQLAKKSASAKRLVQMSNGASHQR
jgi:hypothetical protein